MADLLEFLLEALLNGVEILERWRFSLCVIAGVVLAVWIRAKVDHPVACTVLSVLGVICAVGSGVIWEVKSH